MKWNGKEIAILKDDELLLSQNQIQKIEETYKAKTDHPKFAERFKNQTIPEPNENFTKLRDEINSEIEKRKLVQ